jgi:cell division protein FtsN
MNVDKHISELLFEHDCVIVPEFGGFVANYAPAKIHPVQHSFSPPSKKIVFNSNLRVNDGLLANHISSVAGGGYPQALRHIQHFVDSTRTELQQGRKVKVSDVGTLYLDVEKNIQFEPDDQVNYLLDSFGLAGFQSPGIKRDNGIRRIEKELRDRKAVPAERKKINLKRVIALTVAVPLLAAVIWIPLKTDILKNVDYAALNPFAKHESATLPKKAEAIPVIKDTTAAIILPSESSELPDPQPAEGVAAVVADSTAVAMEAPLNAAAPFHVVAGCFQVRENAEKFLIMLREQNISASIIGQNANGLYVVSCGDYQKRSDALDQLDTLRRLQPNAWLYRN